MASGLKFALLVMKFSNQAHNLGAFTTWLQEMVNYLKLLVLDPETFFPIPKPSNITSLITAESPYVMKEVRKTSTQTGGNAFLGWWRSKTVLISKCLFLQHPHPSPMINFVRSG